VVNVTDNSTPPVLASLSIHPVPPDSAIQAVNASGAYAFNAKVVLYFAGIPALFPTLSPRALDDAGNPIPGLVVEYTSLGPAIVQFVPNGLYDIEDVPAWAQGTLDARRPGQVRLVARTTAYGVTKADTVTYTTTQPITHTIVVLRNSGGGDSLEQEEVTVTKNAIIFSGPTQRPILWM